MRAEFDFLSQIPSTRRAVGAASPSDLSAQPAFAPNGSFGQLLARQLGPIAARTGDSPPEIPPLAPSSIELGVDPVLVPVLPDVTGSARNVLDTEGRVEDEALSLVLPTPPLPAGPVAGPSASGAGPQPGSTIVESNSPENGDPKTPAAAIRVGASPGGAIAGAGEQTADVVLDKPSAAVRPVPGATPPLPTELSATAEPNPNSVRGPDLRAIAQDLPLPPDSTISSLRLDPKGRLAAAAAARPREESPGSGGTRPVQQEALSAPRPAPAALVTPTPSLLESERALLPGDPDRERPESARTLGTSPGQGAMPESAAPRVLASGERPASSASPTPGTAVVQQVEWLAAQGGGTARMRLSPASLGEIEVEVKLQHGRVLVFVRAREQAGQQALAAERSAITQLFGARDLRVSDFVVTPMDGGSAAGDADGNAGGATTQGRERGFGADDRPHVGTPAAISPGRSGGRRSEHISTTAQPGRLDVRV